MKVCVVGTGYVDLVSGACLADVGNEVLCVDTDKAKVAHLRAGGLSIHEPGLDAIVARCLDADHLHFTADPAEGARFGTVQFIAVGTPPDEDGSAALRYVLDAARAIGEHMDGHRVVVDKCTVPVGTARLVRQEVHRALESRGASFSVFSISKEFGATGRRALIPRQRAAKCMEFEAAFPTEVH